MIDLLDEIAEPGFQSAAFLTYGVDLGFFEAKIVNRLLETGCRNAIVLADGHQAKDALNSNAQLRHVGLQCPLVTIRMGNRAFHPKAVLMVGEEKLKVLVGSGNLTIPGYTRNWEVFTKLEGSEAAVSALDLLGVLQDAAARSPLQPAFGAWKRRLESSAPWLFGEEAGERIVRLLSSSDAPILPRVKELLGDREVDEILMASPFFDANASALRWLIDTVSPAELTLLVEDGAQLDPSRVGEVLATMDGAATTRRFLGDGRPLHGKLFLFRGSWGEALLAGSPNASSAALLEPAGRGNFELATFRVGIAGEFSALVDPKIGEPVNLQHISVRRPHLIGPTVAPLELEAAWVSEGCLFVVPAERAAQDRTHVDVTIDQRGHKVFDLRLRKSEDGHLFRELTDEERLHMERASARARLLGPDGEPGAPVWVQNLDAAEKRANPVQRPRYAKGLQALEADALGPEWESWNSLFDAFNAFSDSWIRYTQSRRPRTPKLAESSTESRTVWDPENFYISRDELTLELPRYFARVDNSGVSIGDFEYLIGALPSAQRALDDGATYSEESTDALFGDEPPEEDDVEEEGTHGEETEAHLEVSDEHLQWLRYRLHRKFRSIVGSYEDAIGKAAIQTAAEASYLCLPYPALHKAMMISAREGLLDASQLRGLASRLTAAWTTKLWKDLSDKPDLEERFACAATSLATVAAITSPWLRRLVDADEFDYELYKELRLPLRELRPLFLELKETYHSGQGSHAWEKLVEDYNRLRHAELEEEYFASWTPLQVLDDLTDRYRVWDLDDAPLWQRIADELGLVGAASRDGDVIRVRARLPHVGDQERYLSRLLYSVHGGTQGPAAVLWDNEDADSNIARKAMVLCPELSAVLDISFFPKKRPLMRLHRVRGGSTGSGAYLTGSRYQNTIWREGLIYPENQEQANILDCVASMFPELPIAKDSHV